MPLVDRVWSRTTIHHVVSEFLRSERDKNFGFYPPWLPLIDNPDLSDPLENHTRLRLFYIKRGNFWVEIPPDTIWYEVDSLTENELDELYVSARHNSIWNDAGNKLVQVAAVDGRRLDKPPEEWPGRIILWGHRKTGPFTIMEGNHRMLAYACAHPRPPLKIAVHVGLSSSYCYWHLPDPVPVNFLGNDLHRLRVPAIVASNDWLYVN